jgi:hypothetical protein
MVIGQHPYKQAACQKEEARSSERGMRSEDFNNSTFLSPGRRKNRRNPHFCSKLAVWRDDNPCNGFSDP